MLIIISTPMTAITGPLTLPILTSARPSAVLPVSRAVKFMSMERYHRGDSNSVIDPNQLGQIVKGKITVVASGNIWIADPVYVDGDHDADDIPTTDNPNVLGLIAQGVVKIVDRVCPVMETAATTILHSSRIPVSFIPAIQCNGS